MNKGKAALLTLIIGTAAASAARLLMISKTDMLSGVIQNGSELLCNLLYFGVILLTAAVCAGIWIKDSNADVSGYSGKGSLLIGFGLLIAAVGAGFEGLAERSSLTPSAVVIFVDFLFAALFCITAFVTLYMKEFKPGLGFIYVFGGLYCVLRGVFCFMDRMVVTVISEYFINCLIAIFSALFFLALARVLSGNTGKFTKAALFGFGGATVASVFSASIGAGLAKLLLSSEISDRIVLFSNDAEFYYQSLHGKDAYQLAFPSAADIGLGIFALMAVIAVCLSKSPAPEGEQCGDNDQ